MGLLSRLLPRSREGSSTTASDTDEDGSQLQFYKLLGGYRAVWFGHVSARQQARSDDGWRLPRVLGNSWQPALLVLTVESLALYKVGNASSAAQVAGSFAAQDPPGPLALVDFASPSVASAAAGYEDAVGSGVGASGASATACGPGRDQILCANISLVQVEGLQVSGPTIILHYYASTLDQASIQKGLVKMTKHIGHVAGAPRRLFTGLRAASSSSPSSSSPSSSSSEPFPPLQSSAGTAPLNRIELRCGSAEEAQQLAARARRAVRNLLGAVAYLDRGLPVPRHTLHLHSLTLRLPLRRAAPSPPLAPVMSPPPALASAECHDRRSESELGGRKGMTGDDGGQAGDDVGGGAGDDGGEVAEVLLCASPAWGEPVYVPEHLLVPPAAAVAGVAGGPHGVGGGKAGGGGGGDGGEGDGDGGGGGGVGGGGDGCASVQCHVYTPLGPAVASIPCAVLQSALQHGGVFEQTAAVLGMPHQRTWRQQQQPGEGTGGADEQQLEGGGGADQQQQQQEEEDGGPRLKVLVRFRAARAAAQPSASAALAALSAAAAAGPSGAGHAAGPPSGPAGVGGGGSAGGSGGAVAVQGGGLGPMLLAVAVLLAAVGVLPLLQNGMLLQTLLCLSAIACAWIPSLLGRSPSPLGGGTFLLSSATAPISAITNGTGLYGPMTQPQPTRAFGGAWGTGIGGSKVVMPCVALQVLDCEVQEELGEVAGEEGEEEGAFAAAAAAAAGEGVEEEGGAVGLEASMVKDKSLDRHRSLLHRRVASSGVQVLPSGTGDLAPAFAELAARTPWLTPDMVQRFLIATKGSEIRALERVRDTVEWRIVQRIDGLLQEPQRNFHLWKRVYRHGVHCRSKDGQPVWLEDAGAFRAAHQQARGQGSTDEEGIRHNLFVSEYLFKVTSPGPLPGGKVYKVYDVKGIGMADLRGPAFRFGQVCGEIMQAHYVERLAKAVVVNCPSWFPVVWRVVCGFMDPRTTQRFAICANHEDARAAMLEFMHEEDIPAKFGGPCTRDLYDSPDERELAEHVARVISEAGSVAAATAASTTG